MGAGVPDLARYSHFCGQGILYVETTGGEVRLDVGQEDQVTVLWALP